MSKIMDSMIHLFFGNDKKDDNLTQRKTDVIETPGDIIEESQEVEEFSDSSYDYNESDEEYDSEEENKIIDINNYISEDDYHIALCANKCASIYQRQIRNAELTTEEYNEIYDIIKRNIFNNNIRIDYNTLYKLIIPDKIYVLSDTKSTTFQLRRVFRMKINLSIEQEENSGNNNDVFI